MLFCHMIATCTRPTEGAVARASAFIKRHEEYTDVSVVTLENGEILIVPLDRSKSESGWYWKQVTQFVAKHLDSTATFPQSKQPQQKLVAPNGMTFELPAGYKSLEEFKETMRLNHKVSQSVLGDPKIKPSRREFYVKIEKRQRDVLAALAAAGVK